MSTEFEWDNNKARTNLLKHKISFKEGATIFNDWFVATMFDPDHSIVELRKISIGFSDKNRILVVTYTERGERKRIISFRKATPTDRIIYEKGDY